MNPIYYHPYPAGGYQDCFSVLFNHAFLTTNSSWCLFCFLSTLPLVGEVGVSCQCYIVLLINFDPLPPSLPPPYLCTSFTTFRGEGNLLCMRQTGFQNSSKAGRVRGHPDFFGSNCPTNLFSSAWGSFWFFLVIAILILILIHNITHKTLISTLSFCHISP